MNKKNGIRRPSNLAGVLTGCLLLIVVSANAQPRNKSATGYADRTDVGAFIEEMVTRHGFVRDELKTLFRKVSFQPDVLRAITPPPTGARRSWQTYRNMFVNPQRLEAGLRFRTQNIDTLRRASAEYGVPEEIILAIIGVETIYGRNMGRYRVADALTTLAFDYPPRADYFRSELEQFLIMSRDSGADVFALRGSFAGAFGIPQFMPGSFRRFAVDYDRDGRANLVDNPTDAIASVANFLKEHGWARDQPIAYPAEVSGDGWKKLLEAGIKPSLTLDDLNLGGVSVRTPTVAPANADLRLTLVDLESPGAPTEWWVGFNNFYVITRYNRSSYYAMAVFEFSNALRALYAKSP